MPESNHKPADTRARSDLDDRLGAGQFGQHAQQGADGRGDRACADVDGPLAGGRDDGVLGDRTLGVRDDRFGAAARRTRRVVGAGHARSVELTEVVRRRDTPVPERKNHTLPEPFSLVVKWVALFLRKCSVCSYASHTRVGDCISHGRRRTVALWE